MDASSNVALCVNPDETYVKVKVQVDAKGILSAVKAAGAVMTITVRIIMKM